VEPTQQLAPPVVAVVVVHGSDDERAVLRSGRRPSGAAGAGAAEPMESIEQAEGDAANVATADSSIDPDVVGPGPWFDEALRSIAAQDYANLRVLVLIAGEPGSLPERVRTAIPKAFVRRIEGNPGFGVAANEVLRLVEGDNGFFCFLHDDIALDPDAIRLLVEELYRSNAGIVGPKLVEWDRPNILQHVGFALDRFGELDPIVEPGESDQEQHDAVRDVFVLPSACLLVRADLFRLLGGFDAAIDFHGDDVDLCWRAHLSGARVLVVPSARGRHRELLAERRPDLPHQVLAARHRVRAVATLTGRRRLPLVVAQMVAITAVQFVVALFSGRLGRGWAAVRALVGAVPRLPGFVERRRVVAPLRIVPDREVAGLQLRGSARLSSYLRARDARPDVARTGQRAWRERSGASASIGVALLVLALVVGGRRLILDGVPPVGQFLPYGDRAGDLLRAAWSTWTPQQLGHEGFSPTALGVIGLSSAATLFRTGAAMTLGVLGTVLIAAFGMWRLTAAFPRTRARLVTTAVYVLLPLAGQALSMGRWSALAVFAALPWSIDSMRRVSGMEAGGPAALAVDVVEVLDEPDRSATVRLIAGGGLVAAVATAFAPAYPVLLVMVLVVHLLAGVLVGTPGRALVRMVVGVAGSLVVGVLANVAWLSELFGSGGWSAVVGPAPAGDRGNDVLTLLSFDIGNARLAVVGLAALVPVLVAVLVGAAWRFAWALRGALLVVAFGFVAVLDDSASFLFRMPEPAITLVPVAIGMAICAGCVVASFESDVKGGSFGWRQPATLVAIAAVAMSTVPGLASLTSGRFDLPTTTMLELLPFENDGSAEYRVLWLGDERLVPVPAIGVSPGIAYAVTDGDTIDVTDVFPAPPSEADASVRAALDAISSGATTRAGRLLAPWSIRYIAVPVVDGAVSRDEAPLEVPAGLVDSLGDQLDLAEIYGPPNTVVFENSAWVPIRSVFDADSTAASLDASVGALARTDLDAAPVLVDTDPIDATGPLPPGSWGSVHLAMPFDRGWEISTDAGPAETRPAFGATLAADLPPSATSVTVTRPVSTSMRLVLLAQVVVWIAALAVASGVVAGLRGRRRAAVITAPVDGPPQPLIVLPVAIDPSPTPPDGIPIVVRDEPAGDAAEAHFEAADETTGELPR
jgi:GT2 family glycosyltransferase